jgi:hypothetical protein
LDPRTNTRRVIEREDGFVTAQFMVVAALSMLFLALILNLIAVQYGKGVVKAALDEGVRRGSPAPAGLDECLAGVEEVLSGLLGGPYGNGVAYQCSVVGGEMTATADASFPGWFPVMPDMTFQLHAVAVKESEE